MNDDQSYMTYDEARTRKVAAEAEIAELELAKLRNELAIVADVVSAWDDVLSAMKAKLMSLPTKMGPELAADDDPNVIQAKLEDQIRECLDELSNYDPLSDPTGTAIVVGQPEEVDNGAETAPKANSKRVGRPRKAAKLAE
jgi:hypothetical protein